LRATTNTQTHIHDKEMRLADHAEHTNTHIDAPNYSDPCWRRSIDGPGDGATRVELVVCSKRGEFAVADSPGLNFVTCDFSRSSPHAIAGS
jgi:hypothetical protein